MDQRVEVYGTCRNDLNGKHGVATDFHCYQDDRSRDRYSVLLDSGESYKFRPTAVRAERVGAAGGARPKGKGKKGRGKGCLLYTSPSPRDATLSRMPSSA